MACGGCGKARRKMQELVASQEKAKGSELSRGEKRKIRVDARNARVARRNAIIHQRNKNLNK